MIEKLCCIVLARPYCQIDDIIIVIVINGTTTRNRPPSGTPWNGMRHPTIVSATNSDARRAVACLHPCHPAILNLAHHSQDLQIVGMLNDIT